MWQQAEVPVIEARNAGHEFVFDNLKERLDRASSAPTRSWTPSQTPHGGHRAGAGTSGWRRSSPS
ncbi:MAG: hypothetical protein R2712_29010 [Vicinamibacterales bacterium]